MGISSWTRLLFLVALLVVGPVRAGVPGDVSGDGLIDVADVQCVAVSVVSGAAAPCVSAPGAADLNCDGATDISDLQLVVLVALDSPDAAPGLCSGDAMCGNGFLEGTELCDDGNLED